MPKKEKPEYFEQVVFTAEEADIKRRGASQCSIGRHKWRKISENEIACNNCPTVLIIDPATFGDYIN